MPTTLRVRKIAGGMPAAPAKRQMKLLGAMATRGHAAFWNRVSQVRSIPPKLLERRSTHFTPASPYQNPRM